MDGVYLLHSLNVPHSNVNVANMGPIWGRQDPGGPHVGLMNFAIWGICEVCLILFVFNRCPRG